MPKSKTTRILLKAIRSAFPGTDDKKALQIYHRLLLDKYGTIDPMESEIVTLTSSKNIREHIIAPPVLEVTPNLDITSACITLYLFERNHKTRMYVSPAMMVGDFLCNILSIYRKRASGSEFDGYIVLDANYAPVNINRRIFERFGPMSVIHIIRDDGPQKLCPEFVWDSSYFLARIGVEDVPSEYFSKINEFNKLAYDVSELTSDMNKNGNKDLTKTKLILRILDGEDNITTMLSAMTPSTMMMRTAIAGYTKMHESLVSSLRSTIMLLEKTTEGAQV